MKKCCKKVNLGHEFEKTQLAKITNSLEPVLKLTGLDRNEYILVGNAAEALVGVVKPFTDVDVLVNTVVFKSLLDEHYEVSVEERGCTCTKMRMIRFGNVKIIEARDDQWITKTGDQSNDFPILQLQDMIEWRIWMGRTKDLLRAWELVYLLEESITPYDVSVVADHFELCRKYRNRLSKLSGVDYFC